MMLSPATDPYPCQVATPLAECTLDDRMSVEAPMRAGESPLFVGTGRVESPCTKVCVLDSENICTGCGRNLDEVVGWTHMSPYEQQLVCAAAAERRRQRASKAIEPR